MAKTAGSTFGSWAVVGLLGACVALQPVACTGPATDEPDPVLMAMLADLGDDVVLPALDDALNAASALSSATELLAADPADESARQAAQDAWKGTMSAWQVVEVMQIGPLGSSLHARAGADGRDEVYSWPLTNPCRVDQETVTAGFQDGAWPDSTLVNVKGLDALEYLLWAGPDNACPGPIDINADGTWDALGDDGVRTNRAGYALALANHLVLTLTQERDDWRAFSDNIADAGQAASAYDSPTSALNAVYDALFYIETATKDLKLAKPLGITECAELICPEAVESRLSGQSVTNIAANLDGFERLFTGGDGTGLDDVLTDRGHGDIAVDILDSLDQAKADVAALTVPIDLGVTDEPTQVRALHDRIKLITDALKGDVATVLSMSLPSEAAGDND